MELGVIQTSKETFVAARCAGCSGFIGVIVNEGDGGAEIHANSGSIRYVPMTLSAAEASEIPVADLDLGGDSSDADEPTGKRVLSPASPDTPDPPESGGDES